jgi:hypothetical protein
MFLLTPRELEVRRRVDPSRKSPMKFCLAALTMVFLPPLPRALLPEAPNGVKVPLVTHQGEKQRRQKVEHKCRPARQAVPERSAVLGGGALRYAIRSNFYVGSGTARGTCVA